MKIISVSANAYYIDVIASKAFLQAAKLNEKSSLADKIRAMRGDRSPPLEEALLATGFSYDATLRANRVDLVSFAWPLGQQAQVEGIGETFISPAIGDVPEMHHQIQGVVYTTQEEIDKKRAAIVGFIRGYAKACATILKDPARSRELLKGYYPNLDPKALDLTLEVYRATSVPSNPMPSELGFMRALKFHQAAGLISEEYAYNDLVATKVIADAVGKR